MLNLLECAYHIPDPQITCDNASNNDTMVNELKNHLDIFPGASNRTHCFNHIVNLIAKSVIRQFDTPKVKGNEAFDDVLQELMVSAEDLDREGLDGESCISEVGSEDDDMDGLVDDREDMSETEQMELDDNIQPIRCVLVKVSMGIDIALMWCWIMGWPSSKR